MKPASFFYEEAREAYDGEDSGFLRSELRRCQREYGRGGVSQRLVAKLEVLHEMLKEGSDADND